MNTLKNPLLIVANGEFPSNEIAIKQIKECNSIMACDGAANTLINRGYKPDIIIGDLDSISSENKVYHSDKIIEVKDQNQNDLRKAIDYAIIRKIKDIRIIGATGKREDHTIGNIFSLIKYHAVNIKIFTNTGFFTIINSNKKIRSFKGQQVSIFSLDDTIQIESRNLKYNFNKNIINHLFNGTLNESKDDFFELKISHGELLIFQTYS